MGEEGFEVGTVYFCDSKGEYHEYNRCDMMPCISSDKCLDVMPVMPSSVSFSVNMKRMKPSQIKQIKRTFFGLKPKTAWKKHRGNRNKARIQYCEEMKRIWMNEHS